MKPLHLVLAGLGLALSVSAQEPDGLPAPPDRPASEAAADDDELGEPDGSMRRALAYTQRGLIGELLQNPGSLQASSAPELARELKISEVHAQALIDGARNGVNVEKLNKLLALGLPEGKVVPKGVKLDKLTPAEVQSKLGLTEAEATRFQRFRESARRVHARFREARAIQEARRLGAEVTRENVGRMLTGTPGERLKLVVEALGYEAPQSASAEARRAQESEARSLRASERAGEALAQFRDANGKVEWGRLSQSHLAGGASGFGQFALALFLKELMVAAQTGDHARVQSFLDEMTQADFLIDYSLFAAGAKAADAIYGRHARRMFSQGKLSGFFRTHFVLAAGLAVPSVARGRFELDAYAVDLVSLSLSVTGVKTLVALGRGALPLRRATTVGGARAFKVGGWVFAVGETAVVLWLADGIAQRVDRYLDERRLRGTIQSAEDRLKSLVSGVSGEGELNLDDVARTLEELNSAYDAARAGSTQPLFEAARTHQDEAAALGARIDEALVEGETRAERLAAHPELAALLEAREGSLTGGPDAEVAALEAELSQLNTRFERAFAAVLHQAYEGDVDPDAPAPQPGSRLGSYEAQIAGLLDAFELTSDPELQVAIAVQIANLRRQHDLDAALLSSAESLAPAPAVEAPEAPAAGVAEAVSTTAE